MRLKTNYIDNYIISNDAQIPVIEIENKKYFYRLINDLYSISLGEIVDDVIFIDNENKEVNLSNKIRLFIDYFTIEFNSKKHINDLEKYISNRVSDVDKENIIKNYNKLIKLVKKELNHVDLPIHISVEPTIENIIKCMKIYVKTSNSILDNLFVIIDLENILKVNKLLCFINLKQYLSKEELVEFYKYSIYNNVRILLIDSQSYGCSLEYEDKLIVDENLDEFML